MRLVAPGRWSAGKTRRRRRSVSIAAARRDREKRWPRPCGRWWRGRLRRFRGWAQAGRYPRTRSCQFLRKFLVEGGVVQMRGLGFADGRTAVLHPGVGFKLFSGFAHANAQLRGDSAPRQQPPERQRALQASGRKE